MLTFAVLLCCRSAWCADPATPDAPGARAPAPEPARVYVPYKDIATALEPAGKAVLMDRGEFAKLLAAAGTKEAGPKLGQVLRAEYSATVAGPSAKDGPQAATGAVDLTGALTVLCLDEGPVAVALTFAQLGLTSATMDDKPAPLGYDAKGQLVLLVTGKGEHKVSVRGSTLLKDLAGGGAQLAVGLPPAVAGTLKLSAPGDLSVHATVPVASSTYDKQADRTTAELAVGGQNWVTAALLGNGRQEDERAILLGESATSVQVSRSDQVMSCVYTVQVLRRGVAELRFAIPAGWTVTDVNCPNLTRWDVVRGVADILPASAAAVPAAETPEKRSGADRMPSQRADRMSAARAGETPATLVVRLRKAGTGTQAVSIQATRAGAVETSWQSPQVNLEGAAFQRGFLSVDTGDALRVRGEKLADARREDTSAAAAVAPAAILELGQRLYSHWGQTWSVQLELTTVALRRTVEDRQEVFVQAKEIVLSGRFRVTAVGREMFDVAFLLPSAQSQWELTGIAVLRGGAPEPFEYRLADVAAPAAGAAALRRLTVELARPVPAEAFVDVAIALRQVPAGWNWSGEPTPPPRDLAVPLLRVEADTVKGLVSVTPSDDLSAATQPAEEEKERGQDALATRGQDARGTTLATTRAAPAGLKEVTVAKYASLELGDQVALAWTYDTPLAPADAQAGLMLRISRAQPRIWAQSVGLVTADPKDLTGVWQITYRVTRASTDRLELLADKSLGQTLKIDLVGRRIASRKMIPAAGGSQYDRWLLTLDGPSAGDLVVQAQYERPLGEGTISVPLVRPAPGLEQSAEMIAVQASEELALTVKAEGAEEIDAIDLPPLPAEAKRILSAYRLAASAAAAGSSLKLTARLQERYAIPTAIALTASLRTHLGAGGSQQTQAVYTLTNAGLQFLKVRLPKDGRLWSARVGDQQAKPKRDTDGDYLLPVPRSAEPFSVTIVYACPAPEGQGQGGLCRADLKGLELVGVSVNQTAWTVVPPPGFLLSGQETHMQAGPFRLGTPAYETVMDDLEETIYLNTRTSLSMHVSSSKTAIGTSVAVYTESAEEHMWMVSPPAAAESAAQPTTSPVASRVRGGLVREQPAKPAGPQYDAGRFAGRYTLPVELAESPGAGPAVTFSSLGPARLIVNLIPDSRLRGWRALGFAVVAALGVGALRARARRKAWLVILTLIVASLVAIWLPAATPAANGAFYAAIALVPLYFAIAIVRWSVNRIRKGGRPAPAPTSAPTAVTTAVAFLVALAFGASSALAQEGKGVSPAPNPSYVSDGKARPLPAEPPPLIVPYDGDPTKAEESNQVLVPYVRFVRLWNQVHPDQPLQAAHEAPVVAIADVKYAVRFDAAPAQVAPGEGPRMNVVLTAQLKAFGKGYVMLPMPTGGLAVQEATLGGKPASLQAGPKGTVLLLAGGQGGALRIVAAGTPTYHGRKGAIDLDLPPLPAAVMSVKLPQADLELEAPGVDGAVERSEAPGGEAVWTVPLGLKSKVSLRWMPKAGGGAVDRTLSAAAAHEVHVNQWAIAGVSKIVFTFSAADYDRFVLLLPAGVTLTDLAGANLKEFHVTAERSEAGRNMRVVDVRLHRAVGAGAPAQPAQKSYELTARWVCDLPALAGPADANGGAQIELPLPQAGEVGRESGSVVLRAAGGMTVRVVDVVGGRKTSSAEGKAAADGTSLVGQYYWPYRPFALKAVISREALALEARLDQLVRVSPERTQLLVSASLTAKEGRLFDASFAIPDGYELLSATGPAVVDHYVQPAQGGRRLHVAFRGGLAQTSLSLVLVRDDVKAQGQVLKFAVPAATLIDERGKAIADQTGRLAVQVAPALEAQTAASQGLRSIKPALLAGWLEPAQVSAVRFAYEYEQPDIALSLDLRPLPTKVRVEIIAGLVLQPDAGVYTYRVRYAIEGSPVDRVSFTLPARYAPTALVTSPSLRGLSQAPDAADANRTRFTVTLTNEVTGVLDVAVNFVVPWPRAEAGTKVPVELPALFTDAPQGVQTIVAVQNFSGLETAVKTPRNLEDLPAGEQRRLLPAGVVNSLQYVGQTFQRDWSLSLEMKAAKPPQRIQAVVDLLAITTVIDPTGACRYEVKISLQNRSEQFLRLQVPAGLALWSAAVAGEPVRPVVDAAAVLAGQAGKDEVLIPLVKTSPGGLPYEVRAYFGGQARVPFGNLTEIKPPAIWVKGIQVAQTTWSLRLPAGYRYVRPGGNMAPVAGTTELQSIVVDALVRQGDRLAKSLKEVSYSNPAAVQTAQRNWEMHNRKTEVAFRQLQQDVEENRYSLKGGEYARLQNKAQDQALAIQKNYTDFNNLLVQRSNDFAGGNLVLSNSGNAFGGNGVITGGQFITSANNDFTGGTAVRGTIVVANQPAATVGGNLAFALNGGALNAGVAESVRNEGLTTLPAFVKGAALAQEAELNKELEGIKKESSERLDVRGSKTDAGKAKAGDAKGLGLALQDEDKDAQVSQVLSSLEQQQKAQFAKKQADLRTQLENLKDNRMDRYYNEAGRQVGRGGAGGGGANVQLGYAQQQGQGVVTGQMPSDQVWFAGTTTLSGSGTFRSGQPNALGTGTVYLNGGTLDSLAADQTASNAYIQGQTTGLSAQPQGGPISVGVPTRTYGNMAFSADDGTVRAGGPPATLAPQSGVGFGGAAMRPPPPPGTPARGPQQPGGTGRPGDGRSSGEVNTLTVGGVVAHGGREGEGTAIEGGGLYTGAGTFSLPVALPQGQVQLDFTKPGGDAELSVWVVSERLEAGAYSTGGVLAAMLAALVLWLIVRFIARRARAHRRPGPHVVPAAPAR